MKLLFDTSVLVAALVRDHPHKPVCRPWLLAVQQSKHHGNICCHSLAELYATLTALPVRPQVSTAEVRQLIQETVVPYFSPVALDWRDYEAAMDLVSRRLLRSGMIFDALAEVAARKIDAEKLVTLNVSHFQRFHGPPNMWLLDPRQTPP